MRRSARILLIVAGALLLVCALAALAAAISNRSLPGAPTAPEQLTPADAARLREALHLKEALGEEVWPGWGRAAIPVIVWNRDYSFLVGVEAPPAGWEALPEGVDGLACYRRTSSDPQNFAVRVGDAWAGSMATKQETDAFLIDMFRDMLPDPLEPIFPFRLLIQPSEVQISGVLHETFHAYQATLAPGRLAEAEAAHRHGDAYWRADPDMRADWQRETSLLSEALAAPSDGQAAALAADFLRARQERRASHGLSAGLVAYERQLEWEEGLAKYVALAIWRAANESQGYAPVLTAAVDADFAAYRGFSKYWKQEVAQMRRQAGREGETRFYYTGMAQAVLLDRLAPGWKATALADGAWVEGMLADAVSAFPQTVK